VVVAGQTRPEVIFEILGREGELTPQQQALRDSYREGLAAYRERRWDDALGALDASLEALPGDGPSMTLIERIESLKASPPPQDWNGSWHIEK
jgi:adenylate cyclase